MKAAVRKQYGPPSAISVQELPIPTPKENEVVVKVHATTVNRTDCANLTAKPFIMRFVLGLFKPRKVILGTDFAGVVTEIGSEVKSTKAGDKVFALIDTGANSQAEYALVNAKDVYPIPDGIDFKTAAASLEGAHYAYTSVHKVNIQPGQNVMINGATGAIGSALLQFVRQFDVHITATSDTKNIDLIRTLGANKIFDYTKQDFTQCDLKYDFVFDAVGKSTFGKCRPILKERGIYISSELGPYAQNIFYSLFAFASKKKVLFPIPNKTSDTIPYISKRLSSAVFKPLIDRSYELQDVEAAYEYVIKGMKTGNVLLDI